MFRQAFKSINTFKSFKPKTRSFTTTKSEKDLTFEDLYILSSVAIGGSLGYFKAMEREYNPHPPFELIDTKDFFYNSGKVFTYIFPLGVLLDHYLSLWIAIKQTAD